MNSESPNLQLFKQPASVIMYGLTTTVLAVIMWTILPQEETPIPFVLLPLFVGFLLFLRVWTIALLVLLFLVVLILNEPSRYDQQMQPDAILFAAGMLVFVISACRFYVSSAPLVNVKQTPLKSTRFFSWEHWKPSRVPHSIQPRHAQHFTLAEVWTGLLRACFTLAITMVLLWLVPLDLRSVQNVRLTPSGLRAIVLGISLFFIVMLTSGILSLFAWKRLSPSEARVYLKSTLTDFLHTDLRMYIKQKLKQRRARLKGQ